MRLLNIRLENHRRFHLPPRRHDTNARLNCVETCVTKDFCCKPVECLCLAALRPALHHGRYMLLVQIVDFFDALSKNQKRGDDASRARSKDEIELSAQWLATEQRFNFFEDTKSVEAFCSAAIECEDTIGFSFRLDYGRSSIHAEVLPIVLASI